MNYPMLATVRQQFSPERLADVPGALRQELLSCGVSIRPGARTAIAVGSRGIANLAAMVRTVVEWVKDNEGVPFVVPAMGSHGGATAEGQRKILAGYGITEVQVGAAVVSSMEVVSLPQGDAEVPVYFDKAAAHADSTVLINRIKPHTSFHGTYESGLMKMLAIGLGNHAQALAIHNLGVRGLCEVMPQVSAQVLAGGNILMGVGVVENAYDETLILRAIPAARIADEEPALLETARARMPALPASDIDLLIVDEMGKNISGLGMDTNVIGRLKIPGQPEPGHPRVRVIFARDLTPESHGNAVGMGLADIVGRTLFEKIDFSATYENAATSTFLERAKIPMIADTDRQAVDWALRACGRPDPAGLRVVRIRNTLRLDRLQVSPTILQEISGADHIEVVEPPRDALDSEGCLTEWPIEANDPRRQS